MVVLLKKERGEKKLFGEMEQGFSTNSPDSDLQRRANGYACFIRALMKNESDYLFQGKHKGFTNGSAKVFYHLSTTPALHI